MAHGRSRAAALTRRKPAAEAAVLVCTYNEEATIADALDSALDQTAPRGSYRVVVVDDGSTDRTHSILRRYARAGVDVVRLPGNGGLPKACNAGLRAIGERWFIRLDADDRFEPGLVEALLQARETTGASVTFTDRWEEDRRGRRVLRRLSEPPALRELIAAGALLPTWVVRDLGGYRDLFWEEFDLYLRLIESGGWVTAQVPRPLYVYRVGRAGRMTADGRALAEGWGQLRQMWPEETLARHGLDRV
jgi:glycosyltransferase involved in cell wall biosynthesis